MANATLGGYDAGASEPESVNPAKIAHVIGAVLSIGVLLLLLGWGARTLTRDASGVPVVEAIDGPMRVTPADPGGIAAANQGLSVNEIQGSGVAQSADALRLAPAPTALSDEDRPQAALPDQTATVATSDLPEPVPVAAQTDAIQAQLAQLATANQPPSDLDPLNASVADVTVASPASAPVAAPGAQNAAVTSAVRPTARPVSPATASPAAAPVGASPFDAVIETGTPLAQLGAFDSRATAEREWQRISAQFASYMGGKSPVIQTVARDDNTLFRLRVVGFEDTEDARRFCSALSDGDAGCFPVVMR